MDTMGQEVITDLGLNLGIDPGANPMDDITTNPMDIIEIIGPDPEEGKDIIPAPRPIIGMEKEEGVRVETLGIIQIGMAPAPPLGIRMVGGTIPEIEMDKDTPPKIEIGSIQTTGATIDQHLGIDTATATPLDQATDGIHLRIGKGTHLRMDTIGTPPRIGISPGEIAPIDMQIP